MPTFRYRVEIDPAQVQGQVASVVQAVSGGLQQAVGVGQQGVAYAGQAVNTVMQDLRSVAIGLQPAPGPQLAPPIASAAGDVRGMGLFGLGMAAAGVTTAPINVFQQQFQQEAGMEMAARMRMARMQLVPGALDVAATAAFFVPGLGVPVGAALTAGSMVAGQAVETQAARERLLGTMRQRGLSRGVEGVADVATRFGIQRAGISAAESITLAQRGIETGGIEVRGEVSRLPDETRRFLTNVRELSRALRTTNDEATAIIAEFRQMGLTQQDIRGTGFAMVAAGGPAGARRVGRAAVVGAQAAQQLGIAPGIGQQVGAQAALMAPAVARGLDEPTLGIVGGRQGVQDLLTQTQLRLPMTRMGQVLLAGMIDPQTGQVDPRMAQRLRRGDVNFREIAARAMQVGPELRTQIQQDPGAFAGQAQFLLGPAVEQLAPQMFRGMRPEQARTQFLMEFAGLTAPQARVVQQFAGREHQFRADALKRTQQGEVDQIMEEARRGATIGARITREFAEAGETLREAIAPPPGQRRPMLPEEAIIAEFMEPDPAIAIQNIEARAEERGFMTVGEQRAVRRIREDERKARTDVEIGIRRARGAITAGLRGMGAPKGLIAGVRDILAFGERAIRPFARAAERWAPPPLPGRGVDPPERKKLVREELGLMVRRHHGQKWVQGRTDLTQAEKEAVLETMVRGQVPANFQGDPERIQSLADQAATVGESIMDPATSPQEYWRSMRELRTMDPDKMAALKGAGVGVGEVQRGLARFLGTEDQQHIIDALSREPMDEEGWNMAVAAIRGGDILALGQEQKELLPAISRAVTIAGKRGAKVQPLVRQLLEFKAALPPEAAGDLVTAAHTTMQDTALNAAWQDVQSGYQGRSERKPGDKPKDPGGKEDMEVAKDKQLSGTLGSLDLNLKENTEVLRALKAALG